MSRWVIFAGALLVASQGAWAGCRSDVPVDECALLEKQNAAYMKQNSVWMGLAISRGELMQGGWRLREHLQIRGFEVEEMPRPGSAVLVNGAFRYLCPPNTYGMCKPLR